MFDPKGGPGGTASSIGSLEIRILLTVRHCSLSQIGPMRALLVASSLLVLLIACSTAQNLPLPALDYEYNALEPFIDEATMKVHHLKHHVRCSILASPHGLLCTISLSLARPWAQRLYTDKLNDALAQLRASSNKALAKLGLNLLLLPAPSVSFLLLPSSSSASHRLLPLRVLTPPSTVLQTIRY